jgi:hypothetical protein
MALISRGRIRRGGGVMSTSHDGDCQRIERCRVFHPCDTAGEVAIEVPAADLPFMHTQQLSV